MAAEDQDRAKIDGPAPGGVGLLIVDMINRLDFPGAEALRPKAEAAAAVAADLRSQADRRGTPVIYVNDNFGYWHSERAKLVEACAAHDSPGRVMTRRILPREGDFFIIKPQVSGFYATNLPVLLPKLGVRRLVIVGIATDICVLFTAADAHMRDYGLWVPADGVASEADERSRWALAIMRNSMAAETRPTTTQSLDDWIAAAACNPSPSRLFAKKPRGHWRRPPHLAD
jgi:nicotinamidase-related amidase